MKIFDKKLMTLALGAGAVMLQSNGFAEEVTAAAAKTAADEAMFTVNNLWILVATFLVFIMHLGFATLEAGLTRAKNTVNILFKNTLIPAIGILTYALVGFNLMYPGEFGVIDGLLGFAGFGLAPPENGMTADYAAYTYWSDFMFQGMFAATAATIVSGAVAERVKLGPFLVFSAIFVAICYPITGSWIWGGGWLASLEVPFKDFAGSTAVHSVGGWAALAGVIVLGPRFGKYVKGGSRPIMGHSVPMATIGVFLLWLGWFGFNGGSVLSADAASVSYVFVTTTLGAASGIMGATLISWTVQKHPDLTMVLNGCLAGLVGITAGADAITLTGAIVLGFVCGMVVVFSVFAFDKLRLDDPVGALSVHLVCGVVGTLGLVLFPTEGNTFSFISQLYGVVSVGAFSFVSAFVIFMVLKKTVGIRVDEEEELRGLDIGEHGMEAYSGFQIFNVQ